jgi:membrane fusion protein (multidrug efflux system)
VISEVIQRDVPVRSEWIGTTEGAIDAQIRAQVAGYLLSRDYKEGTLVQKDQLLFRIDPRPYRAALDEARGQLARDEAVLERARLEVLRNTPLAQEGAVSQRELDNAIQSERAGEASVRASRAAVEKARLDLAFTEIRSPIEGIADIATAQVGDLVGPSDPQPLTAVSQLDPIRVATPISEREYLRFAEAINRVATQGGAAGTVLELVLTDGSVYVHPGRAVLAGREVDSSTGTIMIKGEFPNPDYLLRPGQYARVRAVTEVLRGALLVPQRAVREIQGVFQVAVVGADDTVTLRVVEPGPREDGLWVIAKGLAAGERIVVEGIQKLRDGTRVAPKAAAHAAATAAPAPDGAPAE